MPVTVIGYSRKFQTAPYEMEEINFTYSLEGSENPALVIEQLKNLALAHRSPIREARKMSNKRRIIAWSCVRRFYRREWEGALQDIREAILDAVFYPEDDRNSRADCAFASLVLSGFLAFVIGVLLLQFDFLLLLAVPISMIIGALNVIFEDFRWVNHHCKTSKEAPA